MADFGIYGQLRQFGEDVPFSIAGTLPQFTGSITVDNLDFTIAGELNQFEGSVGVVQEQFFEVEGTLPQFSGDIQVAHGQTFAVSGTFKQFAGSITVDHERVFSIAGTLKQFTGAISVQVNSDFSIAGTLPQFTGSIDFAGAFRIISVNPYNRAVTEYTNFDFNSFIEHEGEYYGIKSDGIYLLEGANDDGVAISAVMESGDMEPAKGQEARVTDAFALGKSTAMQMTLYEDGSAGNSYPAINDGTERLQNHRFKASIHPKGVRWRYRITNVAGSKLSIQDLRLLTTDLSRKR